MAAFGVFSLLQLHTGAQALAAALGREGKRRRGEERENCWGEIERGRERKMETEMGINERR